MIEGSSVLITGGSGSFGNAMTRRLLEMPNGPARVSILSRDEVKQSEMRERFKNDSRLRFFLGDVRDVGRLYQAFHGVDYVFHAAALKRIEACAYDPGEAIHTNVLGSMNVHAAAVSTGVKRVVALSTDKACAPSTLYGATKLCMEGIFTASASQANRVGNGTACCVIRYGNVAGSRGSVIPLWRAALERGDRLFITDPDATRFWFTLDGAVDLALWALESMSGGEVFVPDLSAFKLGDLARVFSQRDATWHTMDLRPGEKLHEAMISSDEIFISWTYGRRVFAKLPPGVPPESLPGMYFYLPQGFSLSSNTALLLSTEQLEEALRDA